jgi:hypothetical protein
VCKSEENTISDFGTHIFMGPFGFSRRSRIIIAFENGFRLR